ncbi:hypothetical protein D9M69_485820 [compost metagenome]
MLDPSELRHFYPVIVTPSHDGKFFQNYVASLLNFTVSAERAGMKVQVLMHQGESLVTRARNNCVAQFLANTEWTHLFWIDADIGFSAEAAFRLLLSGYDIAAGVYPLKREDWPAGGVAAGTTQQQFEAAFTRYTVNARAEEGASQIELEVQPDGFMKMTEAPTGFMAIRRGVFERLMTAYPELQYVPDSIGEADRGLHYRFFDVFAEPNNGRYLSEDYGFCRRWQSIGGRVHVDTRSRLSHQGLRTYRGDFARTLGLGD